MIAEPLGQLPSIILCGADRRCPHAVVERFLGAETVGQLLAYVDQHRLEFTPALVYRSQLKIGVADNEVRNCAQLGQIGPFEARLKADIERILPSALEELGLLDRQVIARDFEFCAYGDGGLFKPHHDILPRGERRIVSCVYYFFREPAGFMGGELRLFGWPRLTRSGEGEPDCADVAPVSDRLVIFPSALRHEVRPVVCPSGSWPHYRFTITCWAYRAVSTA
jgi:Rps23 Pro-64 3,4-dihydroxylase Tpa1-like proline 4-hydroxylase